MTCYLLHFTSRYKHAGHYLGSANTLALRLAQHGTPAGARLTQVVREAGIGWTVARTWAGGRDLERRLKAYRHSSLLCPICNPDAYHRANFDLQGELEIPF